MKFVKFAVSGIDFTIIFLLLLGLSVAAFAQDKNVSLQELQKQIQTIVDDFLSNKKEILATLVSVKINILEVYHVSKLFENCFEKYQETQGLFIYQYCWIDYWNDLFDPNNALHSIRNKL